MEINNNPNMHYDSYTGSDTAPDGLVSVDNIKAQMRKGILEYCILLLLRDRKLYANDIIEALKEADLIVVEGTLYPLLSRLKRAGLLSYNKAESPQQGPPRKYYGLTEIGQRFLEQLGDNWNALEKTVNKLKNNSFILPANENTL